MRTLTGHTPSKPNMQNIPIRKEEGRRVRSLFVNEDKPFFSGMDYADIERRFAHKQNKS